MVHPATKRAVKTAIQALAVPLDIGFVFPPKPGEARGFGQWTNRDLTPGEIIALLPRVAAANARGGNVYTRLGPSTKDRHPGIVLLDDLTANAVKELLRDGFEPTLVVETSPENFQAWIRLAAVRTSAPYEAVGAAAHWLAQNYGGDQRAVSPRQPGRLPGFTNRKPKHQLTNGSYPYVRLISAEPERMANAGPRLIAQLSSTLHTGRAAAAAPETPRTAAGQVTGRIQDVMAQLDAIHQQQHARIQSEVSAGRRPADAASASEVDFAAVTVALRIGICRETMATWMAQRRADKPSDYSDRTIAAAVQRSCQHRPTLQEM